MSSITPCLCFDIEAEDAARFYVSVFKNSKMGSVTYYGEGMHLPKGTVLTATFEINGQEFMALNCGPVFKFSEAVSFMINCADQAEIDYYWEKLTADGGQEVQCSWLKDKYGLSWQVVPASLGPMMKSGDQTKINRLMGAVMQMVKFDVAKMEQAFHGE